MDVLHSAFYFILAIGILVTFHELGHFLAARKLGVKVLRFSIGFGKVLFVLNKQSKETEFVISAIPMGGYVKMADEREHAVAAEDLPYAFNRQPVWARIIIVAAGPLFNLGLAVLLFWAALMLGEEGLRPIVSTPEAGTLAAQAGFAEQDEILSINGEIAPTWGETLDLVLSQAVGGASELDVTVKTLDGDERIRRIPIAAADVEQPEHFAKILGLKAWSPTLPPLIGQVIADGAAEQAGLRSGDLLISADGEAIKDWRQWVDYVQSHAGAAIAVRIERDGMPLTLSLTPRAVERDGKTVGKIGAGVLTPPGFMDAYKVKHSLAPLPAAWSALRKTGFYSVATLEMMGKMFVGSASVDNLSGPISIAQYAGQSAEMGLTAFLKFLGLVSVSLGVLNLLPVPVLDGGHLLFFLIEAVRGKPAPERVQLYFQQIGMVLLFSLMVLALFLDVGKLFGH